MAVNPNIKKKADDIRNKVYGKEVRESLASGLEAMSSDVVENEGRQSVVESRQDSVESQWQNVVDETTGKDVISAPEIIAARDGEANLKTRLDKENQEVTAQLAHNVDYFWNPSYAGLLDPTTTTPDIFYTVVKNKEHPFFSEERLGTDESGQYSVRLYKYEPENYEKTIFLVGGLHGAETYSSYFIVKLFDILTKDNNDIPQFEYIRKNVRVLAIPVANPWGMFQTPKTRWNSNGVNLNRNFDYRWAEQPAQNPFDPNYKGTAPFSEKETQYIQETMNRYTDISVYIDYHDLVSGGTGYDYIIYADDKTEKVMQAYGDYLVRNIENPNVRFSLEANDASSNNYASKILNIPSVNIEGNPGKYGVVGSDNDVNGNFALMGNGLLMLANHFRDNHNIFSNGNKMKAYSDGLIVLPNNEYKVIEDSVFSFTPKHNGFVTVTGFAMAKLIDSSELFVIRPRLDQIGYITMNDYSGRWEAPYTSGKVPILPINVTIPVLKGKEVTFQLEAMHEGSGVCHFKRFNINTLYQASTNSKEFTLMDGFTYPRFTLM